jgi:hypothetical protein
VPGEASYRAFSVAVSRHLFIAIVLAGVSGCRREPQCQGKPSNEEIARIRDLAARGAAPCPEHHDPTIELGENGLQLNGRVLAASDELPRDGFIRPIGALFKELEQNRRTWQRVHPGRAFDGRASIEVSPKARFITGASAITTAARAGYLRTRVASGDVSFDATFEVPGSPKPISEPLRELYIVEKPDGRYDVTLKMGRVVVNALTDLVGVDRVAGAVENACIAGNCDVLVPRMGGEFQSAARLLGRLLDLKPLLQRPPKLRFEGD